jgi:uncharacterized protein (TIGR01244 family)
MSDQVRLSRFVTVGLSQPGVADLERLRQDGIRSIVDLRSPDDAAQPLTPEREAAEATALGLSYRHFPVTGHGVDDAVLDRFGDLLRRVDRPVFVHCVVGRRAGMFALSQVAVEQGIPGRSMLRMAGDLRVLYGNRALHRKFAEYVDRRLARPDPLAHRDDVLHQHRPPEPLRVLRARWRAQAVLPARPPIGREVRIEPPPRPGQRLAVNTIALGTVGAALGLLLDRRFLVLPLLTAAFLANRWSPPPQPAASVPDDVALLYRRLRTLQAA